MHVARCYCQARVGANLRPVRCLLFINSLYNADLRISSNASSCTPPLKPMPPSDRTWRSMRRASGEEFCDRPVTNTIQHVAARTWHCAARLHLASIPCDAHTSTVCRLGVLGNLEMPTSAMDACRFVASRSSPPYTKHYRKISTISPLSPLTWGVGSSTAEA